MLSNNYSCGFVILPFPLSDYRMRCGGFEQLQLGKTRLDLKVPGGLQIGSRIRLKDAAHYVDTELQGDIHLLVQTQRQSLYTVARDVQIDLPIDDLDVRLGKARKININGFEFEVRLSPWAGPGHKIVLRNKAEVINGGFGGDIILRLVRKDRSIWRSVGVFSKFGVWGPDKFTLEFGLPLFLKVAAEWHIRKSTALLYAGR